MIGRAVVGACCSLLPFEPMLALPRQHCRDCSPLPHLPSRMRALLVFYQQCQIYS